MNYHINTKQAGHLEKRDSRNNFLLQQMKAYIILQHHINIYNLVVNNIIQNQYNNNYK